MRPRRKRYDPDLPVVGIRRAMIDNGAIDAELDVEPEIIATLYAALGQMLGNAPNYVETTIEVKPAPKLPHEAFVVTVRRADGLTPHQARRAAEARAAELTDALERVVAAAGDPDRLQQACDDATCVLARQVAA